MSQSSDNDSRSQVSYFDNIEEDHSICISFSFNIAPDYYGRSVATYFQQNIPSQSSQIDQQNNFNEQLSERNSDDSPSHYSYAGSSDFEEGQHQQHEQYSENENHINYIQKGMNQIEIDRLPVMKWTRNHNIFNGGQKCSFCLQQYRIQENLRVLRCLHRFHKECLDIWLKDKPLCPLCKHNPKMQYAVA